MIAPLVTHPKEFDKNTNFIGDDGIIYNHYVGDQTGNTLRMAHDELFSLTHKIQKQKKRVLVLTNIVKLGRLDGEARMYAVDFIKDIDFDKVAIYGKHMVAEQIINIIIITSGRGYKMKYFISKEDALLWLSY